MSEAKMIHSTKPKPRDLAALTSPEIRNQALAARSKIQRQIAKLPASPPKYRAERFRITGRHIATGYREAIQAIREATYRNELEQLRSTLAERLEQGYAMTPNPTRNKLWLRLLAEYEIVVDCLSDNALWRYQDRLLDLQRLAEGKVPERDNIRWPK